MKRRWPFGSNRAVAEATRFEWSATAIGLRFAISDGQSLSHHDIRQVLASSEVRPLLEQLVGEDMASEDEPGPDATGFHMSWEQVHEFVRSRIYATSRPILQVPPISQIVPKLVSSGSLTDAHFAISVASWLDPNGRKANVEALTGSIVRIDGRLELLPLAVLKLLNAVDAFRARPAKDRQPAATRRQWGSIRRLAVEAAAGLDDFLVRSIVVTPEKLDVDFRRARVAGSTVVEIAPGFEGAPDRWLEHFDRSHGVPDHFNIPTPDGAIHVALSEPVRKVLGEIKRLPGRRIAGPRAEAFLFNPVSALGELATDVIDLDQFSVAKERAGIKFEKFRPAILKDALDYPFEIGIDIDTIDGNCERRIFASNDVLRDFVTALKHRLAQGLQLLAWEDFEFELDGNAHRHLEELTAALDERLRPPITVHHDHIFDLSTYSDRVCGIGEAEPFMSAYIVKRNEDEGWFPGNLLAVLKFQPSGLTDEVTVPITAESLPDLVEAIASAKAEGQDELRFQGCRHPLPIAEVEAAIANFERALQTPEPKTATPVGDDSDASQAKRTTLLIKGNIDAVEHQETISGRLDLRPTEMQRPGSLKADVGLRDHQIEGVARLQQLFDASPEHCSGVLLADDMGLGKTLQLLIFIASAFEQDPSLPPALIVAPVSLLENWKEEIGRFFAADAFRLMTAYGDGLTELRVPRQSIDAQLQQEGLIRFLKVGWRGDAQVVLTTYETLRDLEFSFAQEPWSILVCDEAQKVKNPNAMVTRAAKKLNVRFRVACTGTPVENSLTDLWCLFDFIEPGLLGALNEFGRKYGRPIEMAPDSASEQLKELRQLIDPQVIRRTKAEVAKDLPRKIIAADCKVTMSNEQRGLYVGVVDVINRINEPSERALHHLAALQYLRLICADPRPYGIEAFVPEDARVYRRKAPKMEWLIRTLHAIKAKNEKALIFADYRDIQRLLQHYIAAEFGFKPEIVNGDTSISAKSARSRQKLIREFQATQGFGVIILSPLAVGFGMNIQAANHVIHYLRHWNPAKEDQATDRAYRIGQTKDVVVYFPLTIADNFTTFDVKLDQMLTRKRTLAGDMLQSASVNGMPDFDLSEVLPQGPETIRDEPVTLELIERCSAEFFEALTAVFWEKQGYSCHLTPQADGGIDVVGFRDNIGVLMQCKTSSVPGKALGWDAVKELAGGHAIYSEIYPTVQFERIAVTNQRFNPRTHERARAASVSLIEYVDLEKLLVQHPIRTKAVLKKLRQRRSA